MTSNDTDKTDGTDTDADLKLKPTLPSEDERCGATKRDGEPCPSWPVRGSGCCCIHGRVSTGPPEGSANNFRHGATAEPLNLIENDLIDPKDVEYELLVLPLEGKDLDRLADPDDPMGECFYWPPDTAILCDRVEDVAPWIHLAADLLGEELEEPNPAIATLVPPIEQAALSNAGSEEVTAD